MAICCSHIEEVRLEAVAFTKVELVLLLQLCLKLCLMTFIFFSRRLC